ncbi:MAG: hypothetical protein CMG13_02530 [Candidatus Marinimicrobia bacterium]|nr:hypothetical protein [Candidatus Neomarinimicrobiota bacterium]
MLPIIVLFVISVFILFTVTLSASLYLRFNKIPISLYRSSKNSSNGLFLAFAIGLFIAAP